MTCDRCKVTDESVRPVPGLYVRAPELRRENLCEACRAPVAELHLKPRPMRSRDGGPRHTHGGKE